jgi:hypothetical protein
MPTDRELLLAFLEGHGYKVPEGLEILEILESNDDQPGFDIYSAMAAYEALKLDKDEHLYATEIVVHECGCEYRLYDDQLVQACEKHDESADA